MSFTQVKRLEDLEEIFVSQQNMNLVPFPEGRKKAPLGDLLGTPGLDHVLIRGLEVNHVKVHPDINSSDHNALSISVNVK